MCRKGHDAAESHPRGGAAAPPGVVVDDVVLEGHVVAPVGPVAKFNKNFGGLKMIFWTGITNSSYNV